MRLTNILLIILICLIAFQKIPLKEERTVSKKEIKEEVTTVKIGKTYNIGETKTVKVKSNNKDNTKHSTTFSQYIDSEGRSNQRIRHNVRIGKDWFISGGVYARQSEWRNSTGLNLSFTHWW